MEGTLRQAGTKLRLAAQLVDRTTGAHLWAENYERTFTPDALFDLQDDLVPRIVSTVADVHGVLPRSMSAAVRSRPPDQLSPYEAVLRSFTYFERVSAEELAAARTGLEMAVQKAPDHADAWAMLALLCVQDYGQGFKVVADSLTRGSAAARRAVEAGPANHLAFFSLAQALFFERDLGQLPPGGGACRRAQPDGRQLHRVSWRVARLRRRHRARPGPVGSGQAAQSAPSLVVLVRQLVQPRTAQGDYRGALGYALKFNTANHWGAQSAVVATCGQLGEHETGARALRTLLGLRPDFAGRVRAEMAKWWAPAAVELSSTACAREDSTSRRRRPRRRAPARFRAGSGAARADEGFWVAVLPFKCASANPDVVALADGLSEAIVSGLSLFSYLRVIARSSTERYAREPADCATVGQEIGARYVHGRHAAAGGLAAAPRRAADRRDDRRESLGRHLRVTPFSPDEPLRPAGRPRAADRLHGRGREWRAAAQHGRGPPRQAARRPHAV